MKLMKRSGIYKASNVTFNPTTCEAHSYIWWCFVKRIRGKLVFNRYRYSVSTARHQNKVRSLIENDLGMVIDIFVEIPAGLQDVSSLKTLRAMAKTHREAQAIRDQNKRKERNRKARERRQAKKLEQYKTW